MIDHIQTPDEWLLTQYDDGIAKPQNHVRPLLEVMADFPPGSNPDYPRWSGQAHWPEPASYADLDRRDAQAERMRQLAQLTARRTA